jgi:hypothetical protein
MHVWKGIAVAAITWILVGDTAVGASYRFSAQMSPPDGATPRNFVTLHLSGVWGDSCVPNRITHHRVADTIYVDVEFPGIDVGCLTVLTPWASSHILGALPAGEYDVVGTYYAVDPYPPVRPREQYRDPAVWVSDYRVSQQVPGDVDHDGRVGPGDLAMLVKEFGAKHPQEIAADINGDAQVSLTDLAVLARHLTVAPPTTVPEPMSMALVLVAFFVFVRMLRRWRSRTKEAPSSPDTGTEIAFCFPQRRLIAHFVKAGRRCAH